MSRIYLFADATHRAEYQVEHVMAVAHHYTLTLIHIKQTLII